MTDPRKRNVYNVQRKAWLSSQPPVCHWCGRPVSDQLPAAHPAKATVDHLIEVDRAPTLALDSRLWVVACWACNSSRGSRYWHDGRGAEPDGLGAASRDW